MRTPANLGIFSALAFAVVTAAVAADPAPPASVRANADGWGAVPDVTLRQPAGAGWGPDGYRGGDATAPAQAAAEGPASSAMQRYDTRDDDRVTWSDGRSAANPAYRPIGRGDVVPVDLRTPAYAVTGWRGYGLGRPGYGQYWIRYYEDALLIDGSGRVIDSRYDIDWNHVGRPPLQADDGYRYRADGYDRGNADDGWDEADDGVRVYRSGPNAPNVSVHRNPDGSTTVTVREEPQVTTTTTYYEDPPTPPRRIRPRR